MSDAPVLGGFHRMEDFDTADDFTKKHTPFIDAVRDGDTVTVTVAVGHYVPHPNTPDHFIDYIELLANHVPIARFDLSAVAVDPKVTVRSAPRSRYEAHGHRKLQPSRRLGRRDHGLAALRSAARFRRRRHMAAPSS